MGREELSPEDIDSYDMIEAWCLFIHRSVHKSKLAVACEVGRIIYGDSEKKIQRILFGLGYDEKEIEVMTNHLSWRKKNLPQPVDSFGLQLSYECKIHGAPFTVSSTLYRPFQYKFGKLSNISTIYDKKGDHWDRVDPKRYFRSGDPRCDNARQSSMTTSHQYEENIIILQTMSQIKKIITGQNLRKFKIRCHLKHYDRGNHSIRKRHKTLFKDDVNYYYDFDATNKIIQTLSFDFVDRLKDAVWTNLPATWLRSIREKVTQAIDSTIKSIKLVRLLGTQTFLPGNDVVTEPPSITWRIIYEIFMDKTRFMLIMVKSVTL